MSAAFKAAQYAHHKQEWARYIEERDVSLAETERDLYDKAHEEEDSPFVRYTRIERHPEVSALKDKLDTLEGLPKDSLLTLARAMRPVVEKLMQLRTHLSQREGADDYPDFILALSGINEGTARELLEDVKVTHIDDALDIVREENIAWESYFDDLRRIEPFDEALDAEDVLRKVENALKTDLASRLTLHISSAGIAGFARTFSDASVHVHARPLENPAALKTFLHELSHALLYIERASDSQDDFLIPQIDEMAATVIEHCLIQIICTQTEPDAIEKVNALEYSRLALSALFELDLWDRVSAPEAAFAGRYGELMPIEHPDYWTLDSFRSLDPFMVQYYAIGRRQAFDVLKTLEDVTDKSAFVLKLARTPETTILPGVNA